MLHLIKPHRTLYFVILSLVIFSTNNLLAENLASDAGFEFSGLDKIDQHIKSETFFVNSKHTVQDIKGMGRILSETSKIAKSNFSSDNIKLITLKFDGLEVYGDVQEKSEISIKPIRIVITKAKWNKNVKFGIGTSKYLVEAAFSPAQDKDLYHGEYCGESDCVVYYFKKQKIVKIEFLLYSD